ncbi:hypothetical protein CEXT_97341 [Caerostris extrusa]|uniref:Uncharacterized protein n=1 Tax=Caerostris extrusa TaxID=172846 RepID=A0AAV4S688_CAEEX|nr:hypothetical protein CEXT_97341 [Caerostris extrusa]
MSVNNCQRANIDEIRIQRDYLDLYNLVWELISGLDKNFFCVMRLRPEINLVSLCVARADIEAIHKVWIVDLEEMRPFVCSKVRLGHLNGYEACNIDEGRRIKLPRTESVDLLDHTQPQTIEEKNARVIFFSTYTFFDWWHFFHEILESVRRGAIRE